MALANPASHFTSVAKRLGITACRRRHAISLLPPHVAKTTQTAGQLGLKGLSEAVAAIFSDVAKT